MPKKSAAAKMIKINIEPVAVNSTIMQEYKKLEEQCDLILAKISERKQSKGC